jgi:hypothetical protein
VQVSGPCETNGFSHKKHGSEFYRKNSHIQVSSSDESVSLVANYREHGKRGHYQRDVAMPTASYVSRCGSALIPSWPWLFLDFGVVVVRS